MIGPDHWAYVQDQYVNIEDAAMSVTGAADDPVIAACITQITIARLAIETRMTQLTSDGTDTY